MKLVRYLGLLTLALLSGCTGTRTTRAPTLLIVGYGSEGSGRVALVADTYLTAQVTGPRFRFVSGSVRELPGGGLPVAYDVAEREGGRTLVAVLSRTGGAGAISLFDTQAIDPEQPESFALIDTIQLDDLDPDGNYTFCPSGLQLDRSGRYLAILNDQSACGHVAPDSLMVIERQATGPVLALVREGDVIGSAIYLYQEEPQRLFYFTEAAAGPALRAYTLTPSGISDSGLELVLSGFAAQRPRDITRVDTRLVVLFNGQFVPIADAFNNPSVQPALATISGSRRLIPLNSASAEAVMVLSEAQFAIHSPSAGSFSAAATASLSAIDGTLEPLDGFVYFVTSGANNFALFDFREYDRATGTVASYLSQSSLLAVPEISEARLISWVPSTLQGE